MKSWLIALSILALASTAPAAAGPAEDRDARERVAEQAREDGVTPAGTCISRAFDQGVAESFCEEHLQCAAKAPAQETRCRGGASRWVCRCR